MSDERPLVIKNLFHHECSRSPSECTGVKSPMTSEWSMSSSLSGVRKFIQQNTAHATASRHQ